MAYARSQVRSEPEHAAPSAAVEPPAPAVEPAGPEAAGGEVEAQFDSEGHVLVGNRVPGEPVVINGVRFTPGELAALVDYVGHLGILRTFEKEVLEKMQQRLAEGCEDATVWDELTGGLYSELSLANEDHFAPGGDGVDHRASFEDAFAAAYALAQRANELEEGSTEQGETLARARLALYQAEHFLQDAFSAGHQVAADEVEARLDAALGGVPIDAWLPFVAADVVARAGDVTSRYAYRLTENPIDSAAELLPILVAMRAIYGDEGVRDALRFAIHERLEVGVEVSSPAHPEPWKLTGDHDVGENPTTIEALELALTECRDAIEVAAMPDVDPAKQASELWTRHAPVPTEDGRATIEEELERATSTDLGIAAALADAMCGQIEAVMEAAVKKELLWRLDEAEAPPDEEAPAQEPRPYPRRSYVPSGPRRAAG